MYNLKKIRLIVAVALSLGIAWKYYKKYKTAKDKLKLSHIQLHATDKVDSVSSAINVLQNGLTLEGYIQVRNFSDKDFKLEQSSVDVYTPKTDKRIAEQTNILQSAITLKAKSESNIPLQYNLDSLAALKLFKESGVIPKDTTLWQVITHPNQYFNQVDIKKLKVRLKGFITAEGINISIDQEENLLD
jgi:hypothetical protein